MDPGRNQGVLVHQNLQKEKKATKDHMVLGNSVVEGQPMEFSLRLCGNYFPNLMYSLVQLFAFLEF